MENKNRDKNENNNNNKKDLPYINQNSYSRCNYYQRRRDLYMESYHDYQNISPKPAGDADPMDSIREKLYSKSVISNNSSKLLFKILKKEGLLPSPLKMDNSRDKEEENREDISNEIDENLEINCEIVELELD